MKIILIMKKVLLLLGLLISAAAAHVVFAQPTEGTIIYEVKVNMHRRLPPDRQEMKDRLPEFDIHKDQLFFTPSQSLYKSIEEEEEDDAFADEGGGRRIRFRRLQAEYYYDQSAAQRIIAQEFMGKKYLIEDSVTILPWKFGTETKTFLGYNCNQASYYDDDTKQHIMVWYTEKLKPFLGPEGFNSLPGTVLLVDINAGERIITAQKIEARPLVKNEIKIPTSGQRITEKDFRKMVAEQRQRRGAPDERGIIIRN
jgi:GLPGLI family protein